MTANGNMSTENLLASLLECTRAKQTRDELRALAEQIPRFDGEYPPLGEVLCMITDGLASIDPEDEKQFTRLAVTRLRGAASASTKGKTFNTVNDLIKHLKRRYAPGRDPASFIAEISRLQIQEGETLGAYIGRTQHLVTKAGAAVRATYQNCAENLAHLEATALQNFLRGLPSGIYYSVLPMSPKMLEEAYDLVIDEDRARRNRRRAMGHYRDDSPARTPWADEDRGRYDHSPRRRTSFDYRDEYESRYRGRRDNIVVTTSDHSSSMSNSDQRQCPRRYVHSPTAATKVFSAGSTTPRSRSSRPPSREREPSQERDPYCIYCQEGGHAVEGCPTLIRKLIKSAKESVRSPDRGTETNHSPASSSGSLNYEGGRLDTDPADTRKRAVRFQDQRNRTDQTKSGPTAILRKPPPQESGLRPRN